MTMTKDEFEKNYAEASGVTVEWLHRQGRCAVPCDCGSDMCEGWAMEHAEMKYYYVNLKILVRAPDEAAAMEAGLERLRYGAPKIAAEASIHSQATDEEVRGAAEFWRGIERSIAEAREPQT